MYTQRMPFSMLICGTIAYASTLISTPAQADKYELLTLFGDVYERVKEEYVEEVEDKKLVEAAINGMLSSLDPHSSYLNEEDYKDMRVQTKGEFGGLGIEVTMENGLVKVVSPIDDTPAYKAGMKSGDLISHIDGEPVMGMTLSEAVDQMRGRVGEEIKITVLRKDEPAALEVVIIRDIIKIKSVRYRPESDIGYLRITSFSEKTYSELRKAFKALEKEIGGNKIKGYVLDLRNNPGGLLDQAIAVSDAFLDKGEIVSTRGRIEGSAKRYNARPGELSENKPVVILINGGSASASEIVAGALQDHKRAVIMGTKSFGKGSVQTVIPLSENGAMRLTTARYYTPSGRSIQAEGIEPDILVEASKIVPIEGGKRASEADLRGHLEQEGMPTPPKEAPEKDETREEKDARQAKEDFQLQRALDFIKGLAFAQAHN